MFIVQSAIYSLIGIQTILESPFLLNLLIRFCLDLGVSWCFLFL